MTFKYTNQLIQSKSTSVNTCPSTLSKVSFKPGTLNLDYGGGRFETATEAFAKKGVTNHVFDPFNRTELENLTTRLAVVESGGADTVTVNNVLNVIQDDGLLQEVVQQAACGVKVEGAVYFLIYEGSKTGVGGASSKGWQRNQKADHYMEFIRAHFTHVERKGNLITAQGPQNILRKTSLFSEVTVHADIKKEAKRLGCPMPSKKTGVGKSIGGCLYVHQSAWDVIPEEVLRPALKALPDDANPVVAKWDEKNKTISLIESHGFCEEPEPSIQRAFKVSLSLAVSVTPEKKDPQIYHHKWNFVREDFKGFSYWRSMLRSISWAEIPCDKSRIGVRSFWEKELVQLGVDQHGAQDSKAPTSRQVEGPRRKI